jgi:hypothetical protein
MNTGDKAVAISDMMHQGIGNRRTTVMDKRITATPTRRGGTNICLSSSMMWNRRHPRRIDILAGLGRIRRTRPQGTRHLAVLRRRGQSLSR